MLLTVRCINLSLQRYFSKSKLKFCNRKYSVELDRTVRSLKGFQRIPNYIKYEILSSKYFSNQQNLKTIRGGQLKQSYNYLLLDPRISRDLPADSIGLENFSIWKRFLNSIFYVGKGKTTRPYTHLYDAMKAHSKLNQDIETNGDDTSCSKKENLRLLNSRKLKRILNIWRSGSGVVCLQVFHHTLPTEAYTREAAIIDALSLMHLTNERRGDYYGPAREWSMKGKTLLGVSLLYKAMQIYLAEGETQLLPKDIL